MTDPARRILVEMTEAEWEAYRMWKRGDDPMVVDSAWLSAHYGKSQEWWSEQAREGVVGAWQESEGSPWSFDREGCERHLRNLLSSSDKRGGVGSRRPWRKAS